MMTLPKKVAVTGAGGQIAYSLLFRIAKGELLGPDQPIILNLLEIPEALPSLEGVKMELEDCAFPLLESINIESNPLKGFQDVDVALLIGAKPRGPGMERSDLLQENAKIFIEQGRALDKVASRDVKVLVVGNPCNTNCWIAMHQAPSLPKKNFFAMTRLDQNRAQGFLARKAGVKIKDVKNVTIWGNHSATQVPDFFHASILGRPAQEIIQDVSWLEGEFSSLVQKRGAAVIQARGKSSAASAAHAIIDTIRDVILPTSQGEWFSLGVCSDKNPYGIAEDLIFSFPCRNVLKANTPEIVKDLPLNPFLKAALSRTEKELIEEREMIRHLIKS